MFIRNQSGILWPSVLHLCKYYLHVLSLSELHVATATNCHAGGLLSIVVLVATACSYFINCHAVRRGSGVTTKSRDVRALTLWQGWNEFH